MDLNVAGAWATCDEGYALTRTAACGHTIAHLLHWMHTLASQTGSWLARLRFSQRAVPVGQVPSAGKALTGSRSPWPASMTAVSRCTKSGALGDTGGGRTQVAVTCAGIEISCKCASVSSTTARFLAMISGPFLRYVFSSSCLMWPMASSRGNTPANAKKQVCITMLMRPAMPARRATSSASTANTRSLRSRMVACTSRGSPSHTWSGGSGALMSKVAPGAACARTS